MKKAIILTFIILIVSVISITDVEGLTYEWPHCPSSSDYWCQDYLDGIEQNDSEKCSKVPNGWYREDCYIAVAENTGDAFLCSKATGSTTGGKVNKNRCYQNVAEKTMNITICDKISYIGDVGICKTEVITKIAINQRNALMCTILPLAWNCENCRPSSCYYHVADSTSNPFACFLSDIESWERCFRDALNYYN